MLLLLVAVNDAILPVPLAGKPIDGLLFTQLYSQLAPLKFTAVVELPLATVWLDCANIFDIEKRKNAIKITASKSLLMRSGLGTSLINSIQIYNYLVILNKIMKTGYNQLIHPSVPLSTAGSNPSRFDLCHILNEKAIKRLFTHQKLTKNG